jgi:valyl-tRNA synthetase
VGDLVIELDVVIDLDKERERLTRQREQLRGAIAASRRKLDNESFVGRAPAQVVQTERDRLAQLSAELENVESSLRALD